MSAYHANQLVAPDRVIVLPLLHHIPRRNVHGVGLDRIETSTPPLPHTAQVRHAIRLVVRQRISVDVELVKLEGREEAAAGSRRGGRVVTLAVVAVAAAAPRRRRHHAGGGTTQAAVLRRRRDGGWLALCPCHLFPT